MVDVGFNILKLEKGWKQFKKENCIQDNLYTKDLLVKVARTGCKILKERFSCAPLFIGQNFLCQDETIEQTWAKIPSSKKRALVEASAVNKVINLYVC